MNECKSDDAGDRTTAQKKSRGISPAQAMLFSGCRTTEVQSMVFDALSISRNGNVVILGFSVAEIAKLFPDDIHRLGSFDSDANRVGADTNNRNRDIITDQNPLAGLSG
jgi:hypothetical protein